MALLFLFLYHIPDSETQGGVEHKRGHTTRILALHTSLVCDASKQRLLKGEISRWVKNNGNSKSKMKGGKEIENKTVNNSKIEVPGL